MKDLFIPYTEALAMKELGFNEPCFGIYLMKEFRYSSPPMPLESITEGVDLLAPLYQQAFRWFREKHDLQSTCIMFPNGKYGYGIATSKATQNLQTYNPIYDTYEEAELECLKQLIKIVKEKK